MMKNDRFYELVNLYEITLRLKKRSEIRIKIFNDRYEKSNIDSIKYKLLNQIEEQKEILYVHNLVSNELLDKINEEINNLQ